MLALLPTLLCHTLKLYSLFANIDASLCEIRNHGANKHYISMLHAFLDLLIFNGRAETKLAMLAFLCCRVCKKLYCALVHVLQNRNKIKRLAWPHLQHIYRSGYTVRTVDLLSRVFSWWNRHPVSQSFLYNPHRLHGVQANLQRSQPKLHFFL